MPANPPAISSWAPYGIIPWTTQEKVSSMLAVRLPSIWYLSPRFLASSPMERIAMVLFAVQMFVSPTRRARLSFAPRGLFIFLEIISILDCYVLSIKQRE